jgi:hypothetical protein
MKQSNWFRIGKLYAKRLADAGKQEQSNQLDKQLDDVVKLHGDAE